MLIRLGKQARAAADLASLLRDCHVRIRRFTDLAEDAGRRLDLPLPELRDACANAARYFREALPRHVADEDETLAPRLAGTSPEVDAALATMHAEHGDHAPLLAALLERLAARAADPADEAVATALEVAAGELRLALAPHLHAEETILFPVIDAWSAATQVAALDACMARRRDVA